MSDLLKRLISISCAGFAFGFILTGSPFSGHAAETQSLADDFQEGKTLIALKLGTNAPVEINTRMRQDPPVIEVEFPGKTVVGALPEVSRMDSGPVKEVVTTYRRTRDPNGARYIKDIAIRLNGNYDYRAWSEEGRVMVEIAHPASIYQDADLANLEAHQVVKDLSKSHVPARFAAMQDALSQAWEASEIDEKLTQPAGPLTSFGDSENSNLSFEAMDAALASYAARQAQTIPETTALPVTGSRSYMQYIQAIWGIVGILLVGLGYFAWKSNSESEVEGATSEFQSNHRRLSSGLRLIDQLVWSAYERQGYKLVRQTYIDAPNGILRTVEKDEKQSALMCVSDGLFCEQRTVEDFFAAMVRHKLKAGTLVTSGNYTIPAQRLAQKQGIQLVGKQQLIELINIGATNEHVAAQLDGAKRRLEDAQKAVKEVNAELENLRRQRNEASWYLGNERVKTATLEEQIKHMQVKLKEFEGQAVRWQQAAEKLRKSWEESQWYLGEARQRVKHLERQFESLSSKGTDIAQNESNKPDTERRKSKRANIPEVQVEMKHSSNRLVFSGMPLDISASGIRVETEQQLPAEEPIHVSILLPGRKRRVVSMAKVVWQHAAINSPRYQSGCELVGLSSASKTYLEQLAQKAEN